MQLLNPIDAIPFLFGLKVLIWLKTSSITEKSKFKVKIIIQVLYLKNPKFLSPLIRLLLKTAFLLANFERSTNIFHQ